MTIEPQGITKGLVTESDFQQAKNRRPRASQFLQIVAKPKRAARKKPEPKLTRVAFRVSRLMEFCTRRELQNQTGHGVEQWPLVVLKELVDNALDACEEAEVAPVISIAVEPGSIVVEDNAGGIKTSTIKSILDYTIRVSVAEAYVSPTRGAQGNALKTILAMGYVLDRERQDGNAEAVGVTIIETRGIEHRIEFRVDHVNNEPRITHTTSPSPVKIGSRITINWPVINYGGATLLDYARGEFIRLAEGYVWFNPHLTLRGSWYGKEFINVAATNPDWKKWGPRNPTSPHWYDETRLQRYLAAHVARDRDLRRNRTVREFIAEFRGLSGTAVQRKVLEEVGCSPSVAGGSSSASSRSTAPASPSCWPRCASTPSRSPPSISASSARIISSSASWPQAATPTRSSTSSARARPAKASHTSSSLLSGCINPA